MAGLLVTATSMGASLTTDTVDEALPISHKLDNESSGKSSTEVNATLRPKDWIITGDFLTGTLSPEAPTEIIAAQKIAIAFEKRLEGSRWPRYDIASRAETPIPTMNAILDGEIVPDFASLDMCCCLKKLSLDRSSINRE